MRPTTHSLSRLAIGFVGLACGALVLAGCASTGASSSPTPASTAQPVQGARPQGNGLTGTIAAVSTGSLEVQSSSTQTTVSYTSATKISQTVAATASAVTVGSCITESTVPASSGSAATKTIAVRAAVSGKCAVGGFGGAPTGGAGGGASGRTRPSGAPTTGSGKQGAGGAGGFTRPVSGMVTAVSGTAIAVSTTSQAGKATTSKITVGSDTKYTATATATSAALVVNRCVTAMGKTNTSGDLAATNLVVSTAGASGCDAGCGGRQGGATGNE
jgi:hypothetical protein